MAVRTGQDLTGSFNHRKTSFIYEDNMRNGPYLCPEEKQPLIYFVFICVCHWDGFISHVFENQDLVSNTSDGISPSLTKHTVMHFLSTFACSYLKKGFHSSGSIIKIKTNHCLLSLCANQHVSYDAIFVPHIYKLLLCDNGDKRAHYNNSHFW